MGLVLGLGMILARGALFGSGVCFGPSFAFVGGLVFFEADVIVVEEEVLRARPVSLNSQCGSPAGGLSRQVRWLPSSVRSPRAPACPSGTIKQAWSFSGDVPAV